MKSRWNLEVSDTSQIMGGFLELTPIMTEKQMLAYVRKMSREFMTNNKEITKYGIWAEAEGNEDISFHIESSYNWKGGIEFMVYDSQKDEIIIDTCRDRLERERKKYEEDMKKYESELNSL